MRSLFEGVFVMGFLGALGWLSMGFLVGFATA